MEVFDAPIVSSDCLYFNFSLLVDFLLFLGLASIVVVLFFSLLLYAYYGYFLSYLRFEYLGYPHHTYTYIYSSTHSFIHLFLQYIPTSHTSLFHSLCRLYVLAHSHYYLSTHHSFRFVVVFSSHSATYYPTFADSSFMLIFISIHSSL